MTNLVPSCRFCSLSHIVSVPSRCCRRLLIPVSSSRSRHSPVVSVPSSQSRRLRPSSWSRPIASVPLFMCRRFGLVSVPSRRLHPVVSVISWFHRLGPVATDPFSSFRSLWPCLVPVPSSQCLPIPSPQSRCFGPVVSVPSSRSLSLGSDISVPSYRSHRIDPVVPVTPTRSRRPGFLTSVPFRCYRLGPVVSVPSSWSCCIDLVVSAPVISIPSSRSRRLGLVVSVPSSRSRRLGPVVWVPSSQSRRLPPVPIPLS